MINIETINKRAYIFDLFHTLTGIEPLISDFFNQSFLHNIPEKVLHELIFTNSDLRLKGIKTDPLEIIKDLASQIAPYLLDRELIEIVNLRIKYFEYILINIPHQNIEVLKTLKKQGYLLGLLSNADVMEIRYWNNLPISKLFDTTIFSCNVGYAKPEIEIYELSLNSLGIESQNAIFIGDGGSNELQGAKSIGLTTVIMKGIIKDKCPEKINERCVWADYQIEQLNELTCIFPKI
jgi:putative hydrolase of the HAD superfamily